MTLLGYLADRLTGKWIRTPKHGWKRILDAVDGHRAMVLVLEGGGTLRLSYWARVEIEDADPTEVA